MSRPLALLAQFEGVVGATGAGAELVFGVTIGVSVVVLLVGDMVVLLVDDADLAGAEWRVAFDGGRVVVVIGAGLWMPWRRPAAGAVEVVGERTGMVEVVGTVGRGARLRGGVIVGGG